MMDLNVLDEQKRRAELVLDERITRAGKINQKLEAAKSRKGNLSERYVALIFLVAVLMLSVRYYDDALAQINPFLALPARMIPVRLIESYGGTVAWDDASRRIVVSLNNKSVSLQVDNATARVNGSTQQIVDSTNKPVPPVIVDGTAFVLMTFFEQVFDLSISPVVPRSVETEVKTYVLPMAVFTALLAVREVSAIMWAYFAGILAFNCEKIKKHLQDQRERLQEVHEKVQASLEKSQPLSLVSKINVDVSLDNLDKKAEESEAPAIKALGYLIFAAYWVAAITFAVGFWKFSDGILYGGLVNFVRQGGFDATKGWVHGFVDGRFSTHLRWSYLALGLYLLWRGSIRAGNTWRNRDENLRFSSMFVSLFAMPCSGLILFFGVAMATIVMKAATGSSGLWLLAAFVLP